MIGASPLGALESGSSTTMRTSSKIARREPRLSGEPPVLLDERAPFGSVAGIDYLPFRISLVARLLHRRTTRMLALEFGLSMAEWRVLAQLAMYSPSSVRALAERNCVDRAEVSRAAASLVRRRYVRRQANPEDRRGPLLSCTAGGKALFRRIRPRRAAFDRLLTSHLDPTHTHALDQALLVLARGCAAELRRDANGAGTSTRAARA
jgi:DNA-binding MarR family transcriptional regulator